MKTEVIVASALGVIIAVGILGVRRFLKKKSQDYHDYYSDFHRHFERKEDDAGEGVEYFAMQ